MPSAMRLLFPMLLIQSLYQEITSTPSSPFLPPSWLNICETEETPLTPSRSPVHNATSTQPTSNPAAALVKVTCNVPKSDAVHWSLLDLRAWIDSQAINKDTDPADRDVLYQVLVTCHRGANISLPWPMKATGLKELRVRHCNLVDRYADYMNATVAAMPDELRVLDIRHSVWLVEMTNPVFDNSNDKFINISSDYDCGQDTSVEIYIASNVSDAFLDFAFSPNLTELEVPSSSEELPLPFDLVKGPSIDLAQLTVSAEDGGPAKPEDRLIKDAQKVVSDKNDFQRRMHDLQKGDKTSDLVVPLSSTQDPISQLDTKNLPTDAKLDFLDLLRKSQKTRTFCNYQRMKVLDESMNPLTPLFHFEFMVQGADHPVLELLNFSRIGLQKLPRELAQWRRYFPKLRFLDLSFNNISEINVPNIQSESKTNVIFNLRHNKITTLRMETILSWARVSYFHVDVRDNPLDCGCDMTSLLPALHNASTFSGQLEQYEYLRYLTCKTPPSLAGRKLHTLRKNELPCPEPASSNKGAVIALGVITGIVLLSFILVIRYKVEIRILLYTRLHVRLPCDVDSMRTSKKYDAFVSYSNEDASWVYENLVKYLETPETPTASSPPHHPPSRMSMTTTTTAPSASATAKKGFTNNRMNRTTVGSFRLCMHQRDFIPGKTIFDNIVDSIEASRHTIIVLSPSFMRSHWALEELRQAYRQSLVEKARHLIVVLLEKVAKEEMDPLISRCCRTFTYLEVNDLFFKDRLVFSLTTKDRGAKRRDKLASREQVAEEASTYAEIGGVKNDAYSSFYDISSGLHRAPQPTRELSNTSTTSTTALTGF